MIFFVQCHAHGKAVLLPQAAEGGAGARLNAPHAEACPRPLFHCEVLPEGLHILFLYSNKGYPRGAGEFHRGHIIFFRNIREPPQGFRGDDPAGYVGSNGIGFFVALKDNSFFSVLQHCVPPS